MDDDRTQDSPAHRGPADILRDGHLKASIWRNEGEKGHFFSTTLSRTYEDRDGKLKDSQSFAAHDLLRVSELARSAYTRSRELQQEQAQLREMQQPHQPTQERGSDHQRDEGPAKKPAPERDREQRRQEFEAQRRESRPAPTQSHDKPR